MLCRLPRFRGRLLLLTLTLKLPSRLPSRLPSLYLLHLLHLLHLMHPLHPLGLRRPDALLFLPVDGRGRSITTRARTHATIAAVQEA